MSLLDLCPAGSLLEEPRPQEVPPDATAEQALREKILADCLPAQREFLAEKSTGSLLTSVVSVVVSLGR